jgi:hypothetical protein
MFTFLRLCLPLDENQRVEKHHKKSERTKIYKEFANYSEELETPTGKSKQTISTAIG